MIAGNHFSGIRQFTQFFLRWRVRALAYLMLLEDQYPPFGDLPYPARPLSWTRSGRAAASPSFSGS